ncbi:MAG: EB domain-containing protein [Myxococcaceae bacterium]
MKTTLPLLLAAVTLFACPAATPTDPCSPSPCGVGGQCTSFGGVPFCSCNLGFTLADGTCREVDACATNPCTGGKQCTSVQGAASCSCPNDLIDVGGQCVSQLCSTANCGTVPHQTVCTVTGGVAKCSCEAGYQPTPTGCSAMPIFDCAKKHTGDAQEPDECPSLAGTLDGLTQQHTLAPAGDVDWMKFTVPTGHIAAIDVRDLAGVTLLDVYGADGLTSLASNHAGPSPSVRFVVPSTNASTLYVRVSSATGSGSDVYEITLRDLGVDDLPDQLSAARSLGSAARFEGEVQFPGDVDVVRLDTVVGDAWSFSLDSFSDVDVELLAADGSLLQRLGSSGTATLVAADTSMYLRAKGRYATSVGAFSLSVTALGADDYGDDAAHATAITPDGTSTSARWERAGDLDVISFQATSGHSYALTCASSAGCRVTATHPSGTITTASSSTAINTTLNPTSSGTMTIAFSSYSGATAPYSWSLNDLSVDDVGDDATTAEPLQLGATRTAGIQTTTDHDFFSVTVATGQVYVATCTSTASYLCAMTVRTASGTSLGSTSYGYGSPTTVSFVPTTAGTVTIDVFGSSSTGTYTLSVVSQGSDDHGNTAATATAITAGSTTSGNIQFSGDLDVFSFSATSGAIYSAQCTTSASYLCKLTVRDASGTSVATTSYGTSTTAWFKASAAGTYTIEVAASYTGYFGAYSLVLSSAGTDDFGDTTTAATTVTLGASVTGATQFAYDHDVMAVAVTAGHIYTATCTTTASYLCAFIVRNDAGTQVTTTSYGTSTTATFVAAASGTYTFDMSPASSTTGSWTFRVADSGTDDFGDTPATAGTGTVGTPVNGNLQYAGDKDVVSYATTLNHVYAVGCTGSQSYGCNLTVRDSTGTSVATTSYGTSTTVSFKALGTGPYTVEVKNYYSYTGTWTLTVTDSGLDDHGDTAATGTALTLGGASATGSLQYAGDKDVFTFTATAGTIYRFGCTTSATYLCALSAKNATGTVVATSSYGTSTQVAFKAAASGTFSVEVSSTYSYLGAYSVQVGTLTDDHGDTPGTGTAMTLGQTKTGNLDYAADVDYFQVSLTAGTAYTVTVTPSTVSWSVVDPTLGTVSLISGGFTAATTGTYYVRVAATASTLVPYSVVVQ